MNNMKFWMAFILIITALIAAYFLWYLPKQSASTDIALVRDYQGQGTPDVGGAFTLVDHTGKTRQDRDFRGKYMMVYFGYRYCPDICPTALSTISETLEKLGAKAGLIQPIFITVDPERDQIEELAEYVQNFHPRLIGLTGSKDQIEVARKAYRVFAVKAEEGENSEDYLIDHSSIIYVMDRQGHLIAHFNHTTPPDEIVKALRKVI